jgi:hypothetical protein
MNGRMEKREKMEGVNLIRYIETTYAKLIMFIPVQLFANKNL